MRGWKFEQGLAMPTESEITYALDPSWQAFVAVIGLADGWQGAGPYELLVDDKLIWSSEKTFARNDQGRQISVPLPPDGKTLVLRLKGKDSVGALAHAGFVKDDAK